MTGQIRIEHQLGADMERVGEYLLPPSFRVVYEDNGTEPDWEVDFEIRDGTPQCRAVHVHADADGDEVTAKHLRHWRLEDLLEGAIARIGMVIREHGSGGVVATARLAEHVPEITRAVRAARATSRSTVTERFLRDVADVYRDHDGHAPTQAVAKHFGKSLRTAGLYVRRAREAGVLESQR